MDCEYRLKNYWTKLLSVSQRYKLYIPNKKVHHEIYSHPYNKNRDAHPRGININITRTEKGPSNKKNHDNINNLHHLPFSLEYNTHV